MKTKEENKTEGKNSSLYHKSKERWKATLRHENTSTKGNGKAGKKDMSIKKKITECNKAKKSFCYVPHKMDSHK